MLSPSPRTHWYAIHDSPARTGGGSGDVDGACEADGPVVAKDEVDDDGPSLGDGAPLAGPEHPIRMMHNVSPGSLDFIALAPPAGVTLVADHPVSSTIVSRRMSTTTICRAYDILLGKIQVHQRGSILQRLFSHDAYQCGELSQTLGIHGLPQIDLWRPD